MGVLRLIVAIAVIVDSAVESIQARTFKDDVGSIKRELQVEFDDEKYVADGDPNSNWLRLSKRSRNDIVAHCGLVAMELLEMGRIENKRARDFEAFREEDTNKLVSYEPVALPVEGIEALSYGKKRVIRLTAHPYVRTHDIAGNRLARPIIYKNGLLIADSHYDLYKTYVFSKKRGANKLTPILTVTLPRYAW